MLEARKITADLTDEDIYRSVREAIETGTLDEEYKYLKYVYSDRPVMEVINELDSTENDTGIRYSQEEVKARVWEIIKGHAI